MIGIQSNGNKLTCAFIIALPTPNYEEVKTIFKKVNQNYPVLVCPALTTRFLYEDITWLLYENDIKLTII